MPDPAIPAAEYAARRRKLASALDDAVGVVFAGTHDAHLPTPYRPHPHFEYLTGVTDEPDAVLVLHPGAPVPARREMLFLRALDPEVEKWDGYRLEIGKSLRDRVGLQAVFRARLLPRFLSDAARRAKRLACLHPLATYDQPVSPDLAIFRRIVERVPGVEIIDHTDAIARLRAVKSSAEVKMIQRAIDITAGGFDAAMRGVRPGMNEFDLQETLEHAYRTDGSRGPAFGTIAGSGVNSTVLHYAANDRTIADGDLICVDSGASFGGYGADITRTIPANGRFTTRQREIYDIVLRALGAATKAVKPGVTIAQLDKIARAVIIKAGFGDAFIHGIGHHLGLETHDVTPDGPLKAGNVITIEPGIYLPDEAVGVRIEDDVLVTKDGHRVLSAKIPRTAAAIEKVMSA
jgi:Xaa-Pro aminopeptidase